MMTGATHKETVVAACWPNWDNKPLAELVQANIELVGMPNWSNEDHALAKRVQKAQGRPETGLLTEVTPLMPAKQAGGFCDSGDITYVCPHARIHFPATSPAPKRTTGLPGSPRPHRSPTRARWRARRLWSARSSIS